MTDNENRKIWGLVNHIKDPPELLAYGLMSSKSRGEELADKYHDQIQVEIFDDAEDIKQEFPEQVVSLGVRKSIYDRLKQS